MDRPLTRTAENSCAHDRAQKRDVLADQLLLKGDRVCRDNDLLLVLDGGLDGRHQVGKALADARTGLDEQMSWPFDGSGDRPRHRELLVAVLVRRQPPSDHAVGAEDRSWVEVWHDKKCAMELGPRDHARECEVRTGRRSSNLGRKPDLARGSH